VATAAKQATFLIILNIEPNGNFRHYRKTDLIPLNGTVVVVIKAIFSSSDVRY
jgi:hypothetical protein